MIGILDLRKKIKSTENTAQITKAMQLVSAVKMRKIQQLVGNSREYLNALKDILIKITESGSTIDSPFLKEKGAEKKVLLVVISTSRGFVGAINTRLGQIVHQFVQKKTQENITVEIMTVKKKSLKLVNRYGLKAKLHFDESFETADISKLSTLKQAILEGYEADEYQAIYLAYPRFVNTLVQEPEIAKFLPFSLEEIIGSAQATVVPNASKTEGYYKFEPGINTVLTKLLTDYLELALYDRLLQSAASEYSARMVTMKKATDNAYSLKEKLQLLFYKTRQAAITSQIQENINSALALS